MRSALSHITWTLALTLSAWLLVVPAAGAYIDGASGSMIIQFVVGFFMAAALAIKVHWHRLRAFISRRKETPTEAGAESR